MKYILVDIETDGPSPFNGSMLSLGACTLDIPEQTWYSEFMPLSEEYNEATVAFLKKNGLDREELKTRGSVPRYAMEQFDEWLTNVANGERLRFVADNAGFDWMFVCSYLSRFVGRNQFGFSALSLTSLYGGFAKDIKKANEYKKWRTVTHSHNALDDARGNAGAMRVLQEKGMVF